MGRRKAIGLTNFSSGERNMFRSWQLRARGLTQPQVAQILSFSVRQIQTWDMKRKGLFEGIPEADVAALAFKTYLPDALQVYADGLHSADWDIRYRMARDILRSFGIIKDKVYLNLDDPDARKSTEELIAEFQSIAQRAQGIVDKRTREIARVTVSDSET